MTTLVVLSFYDDKHADALIDTLENHPMNIKELGEFVQQSKVFGKVRYPDEASK